MAEFGKILGTGSCSVNSSRHHLLPRRWLCSLQSLLDSLRRPLPEISLQNPAVVVSVNYHLSPEHRYPSQYDGFDVVTFLDKHDAVLPKNANRSRVFLVGDSAGGNLAHHVALRACRERSRLGTVKLAGLIAIQPWFGTEERTESEIRLEKDRMLSVAKTDWFWKAFLPEGSSRDHEVANVNGPNAVDTSGLWFPTTVVVVGGVDLLQDRQRGYFEWLRKSGIETKLIEYPMMFHGLRDNP